VIRLLHIFPAFGPSLGATRLSESARVGRGFSHHVISLDGDLSALEQMPSNATGEAFVARRGGAIDQLGLRQRIAASGADILCTYGSGALDAAIANAMGPKLPHLHHVEDGAVSAAEANAPRLRSLAAAGGKVVVSGASAADAARKVWRIPAESLKAIAPGVNTRKFRPYPGRAKDAELTTVGFVGDLIGDRGVRMLVRVLAALRARPPVQFAIYGEGPGRPAGESLARSLGLRRAHFLGPPPPSERLYDEFDILLICMKAPPMDRLLEAMAAGLPVVSEEFADLRSVLSEENGQLIVAPRDAEGLSAVLSRLVNEAAAHERIGAANAAKARSAFPLSKMTAEFHRLWRETATPKVAGAPGGIPS
jgi:glycosyltransferase involved in cell wall biosynthesis